MPWATTATGLPDTYPVTVTGTLTIPLVNGQSTTLPTYDDGNGDKGVLSESIFISAGP
jgi:hypothetical protein